MSQETHLAREIRTQPDNWLDVADRVAEFEAVLPARGQRVLAVGCGTSFYMAQSYARLRADAGYESETDLMASIRFDQATRFYTGVDRPAVDRLDLDVKDGEFLVLVGPSGCGKSTTLRMLAGLEGVDEGKIFIGDKDVTDAAPSERDLAMVFQNYALYPHMTVAENIGFHLKIAGEDKAEITKRVAEAAQILDLTQYLDRKPAKLSGGQRQRVAMGRAIVRQPQVFLMDEPLSNLDAKLRMQTRTQIASLQRRLGVTTVYVTHDQVEAMTMGDRVAVLKDGVLQQVASPIELFRRPANIFVAGFIGSPGMNLIRAKVVDGAAILAGHAIPLTESQRETLGGDVVIGIRPEGLVVTDGPGDLRLTTEVVEELGSDRYLYCTAGDVQTIEAESGREGAHILTVRDQRPQDVERGEVVDVTIVAGAVHVFDPTTGLRVD